MTKLLVVDDEPGIQKVLGTFFSQKGYDVRTAGNGEEALASYREHNPHLVFLDVRMDGALSGIDVLKEIRKTDGITRVIMITAVKDDATFDEAKSLGATDYVTKPFDLEYLQNDVLGKVHEQLYEEIRESNERLQRIFRGVVEAFVSIIGKIDPHYTGMHIGRTIKYGAKIAHVLKQRGVNIGTSEELFMAGILLHDVGKIFTPREILHKEGPLNEHEWAVMKKHPVDGAEVIGQIEGLEEMAKIIRHHQEKYDGTGYPDGLKGETIPLGSRVAAVVDAFDAMITDRPYRQGMPIDQALQELTRGAGTQFDPKIVDLMVELSRGEEFRQLLSDH